MENPIVEDKSDTKAEVDATQSTAGGKPKKPNNKISVKRIAMPKSPPIGRKGKPEREK